MKTDIDRLMQEYNIDFLLITGSGGYNPFMVYLTGGGHFSDADLIKKRGEAGILFHHAIERDEAAKTGLPTRSFSNYPIEDILKETGGDYSQAITRRYLHMFNDLGIISGRVAIYGQIDLGKGYSVFKNIADALPGLEFIGFQNEDLMMLAMATKSPDELERIRRIGMTTTEVVGKTADYLSQLREKIMYW
jgi:Xaa-Pro aminopeptidase